MRPTFHIVPAEAWAATDPAGPYAAPSLASEGFIHCTDGEPELIATANRHYRDDPGAFLALTLDLDATGSPWRIDDPAGIYPHVYGPIDLAAVLRWTPLLRDGAGQFTGLATTAPARPSWVPDELYPFEDHWAEIDGHLVHYVDEGAGPPLLLLNGNPSWSFGWRDVILSLRATFRCIAPDYPGFGLSREAPGFDFRPQSQSKVVEALVDRLDLSGMVVFGYAWGGPIGLGLAGRRPELIRALVVGNTWAWPDDRLRVRLFAALLGGPLSWLTVERLNLMLRLYLPRSLKRGPLTTRERAAYDGPFPRDRRHIMSVFPHEIAAGRAYLRAVEANLGRIADKPALILWPDADPGFGDDELRRWQTLYPAAPVVHLRTVGQFVDEDAPDDVAAAIRDWWSTGPGARAPGGRTAPP